MVRSVRAVKRYLLSLLAWWGVALLLLAPRVQRFEPPGAYEVAPRAMWREEYAAAERCAGRTGEFEKVRWFLVPTPYPGIMTPEGWTDVGLWSPPHRIYIAEGFRNFEWVIRHESLHDLTRNQRHPVTLFGYACKAMFGYLEDFNRGRGGDDANQTQRLAHTGEHSTSTPTLRPGH